MKLRKTIAWMMCVLIFIGLVGCSSAPMSGVTGDGTANEIPPKEEITVNTGTSSALPENRKLVQTVNMNVETENLDIVLQQINDRIAVLGGYIENSNIQNGSTYNGNRNRITMSCCMFINRVIDNFKNRMCFIDTIHSSAFSNRLWKF